MAERPTCAALITRLRALIGDRITPDALPTWSDAELQDALDNRRERVDLERLSPVPSYADGSQVYLSFQAIYGDWEEDAILYDSSQTVVTPSANDYQGGRWTFESEPHWPVYLSGSTFCLYGAAADVLEMWTALKPDFDFKSKDREFKRSQVTAQRAQAAELYKRKARPRSVTMVRTDVNTGGSFFDYDRMLRR